MQKNLKIIFTLLPVYLSIGSCNNSDDKDPCSLTVELKSSIHSSTFDVTYEAVVSGGLPPYEFKWTGGDDLANFDDSWRIAGIYDKISVIVIDALGCEAFDSYLPLSNCGIGDSVIDPDGNKYGVISIGTQCWIASNLRASTGISQVTDSASWITTTSPAWCYYNNDPANVTYGKIYNWYAVQQGNLCPSGWRIPTQADWQELENFLGNEPAGKMKSTTGWQSPNTGAINSSKFNAIPAGYRIWLSSRFEGLGQTAGFWSATQASDSTAFSRALTYDSPWLTNLPVKKRHGYSCRCIKN
ncbi:MAG: fibrobacter succinogenes major paralogous domain-containing protein [Saprospiraceae bacterium]|nr:fibrobacter succinogenes major paralogous domain-containing protein [Candidatus Vicinibacter affinis]MBP6174316.1 fibrobacter succinogenes major paralogous domain-containing protein [Saprospiraceae bacterium]MBK6574282.1 fibrobacter succinogenes major paralogous domain-containing protein [Candidatus Vicinibacter affinis]MBK6824893.1 fibrobacter succinogenes major paralogous domain-containing protein [Candidatus Vicinibacter affinis]MBK7800908.1 fibrobacter succinogenes major paralogous domai